MFRPAQDSSTPSACVWDEIVGEALPNLVKGKISVEEFTRLEDESIERFLKEQ